MVNPTPCQLRCLTNQSVGNLNEGYLTWQVASADITMLVATNIALSLLIPLSPYLNRLWDRFLDIERDWSQRLKFSIYKFNFDITITNMDFSQFAGYSIFILNLGFLTVVVSRNILF